MHHNIFGFWLLVLVVGIVKPLLNFLLVRCVIVILLPVTMKEHMPTMTQYSIHIHVLKVMGYRHRVILDFFSHNTSSIHEWKVIKEQLFSIVGVQNFQLVSFSLGYDTPDGVLKHLVAHSAFELYCNHFFLPFPVKIPLSSLYITSLMTILSTSTSESPTK